MIGRLKRLLAGLDAWSQRHRLPRVSRRAISGFLAHDALQFAGSMAYFAVLSVFQLLVLGIVVGSFFLGDGPARAFVVEQVSAGTPLDAALIEDVIDATIESRGSMTIIGLAFLAWSGLGIFSALSNGISRVFSNAPRRGFVADKLVGLLLMTLTGMLAVGSLAIGLLTGVIQQLTDSVAGGAGGDALVWLIGLVLPIVLIFIAFWVIYKVVPNRSVSWGEVLPGAVVATALWTVLRFGFTWYATNVADYDSAFGPISTAVTLLVFLYFASVIVLLGAEFARASAVDDEVGLISSADPRFLPVLADVAAAPAPGDARRGVPGWVAVGAAAVAGAVIGRVTKRDRDDHL